jgi:hypothetical protein
LFRPKRSPEVVRCLKNECLSYDPLKADIYSLGKILDYMIGYSLFDVYVYGEFPPKDDKNSKRK